MLQLLHETTNGNYFLSTNQQLIDIGTVHRFLTETSNWARGIPRSTVEEAIQNSLCFGLYENGALLAFCRIVTDGATFGNLVDVFMQPDLRGRGLSKLLMAFVMSHPLIPTLRRLTLATSDDKLICIWDGQSGELLHRWQGHQGGIHTLAYSSDGATLASASEQGDIRLWDGQTGVLSQTLRPPRPYAGMDITGVTGITAAQKAALLALGAVEKA